MTFLGRHGYPGEADKAKEDGLLEGFSYLVTGWDIRDMSSFVEIYDNPGVLYSTVMFSSDPPKPIELFDKVMLHDVPFNARDKLSSDSIRAYRRFEEDGLEPGAVYNVEDVLKGEISNHIILKQFPGNSYPSDYFSTVSWDTVKHPMVHSYSEDAVKMAIADSMANAVDDLVKSKKLTPQMLERLEGLVNAYYY